MGEDSGFWNGMHSPCHLFKGTTFPQNLGKHVQSDAVSHPRRPNSKYNGCRHPKSHLSHINASGRNVLPDQTNFKIQSQQKHTVPSWDVHREQ